MKTPAPTPEDLAGHLAIERFGSTAEKVRATAALIAAADTCWEKGTITAFQTQHKINAQVWDKLVWIAGSANLESLPPEVLPASYTALYALVVMTPEELKAAVSEGLLKSTKPLSSRAILDWTKAFRLRGRGIEQEVPLTLVLREDLSEQQKQNLLKALSQVADGFGAELLEGKGGVKQAGLKADRRKTLAAEIEEVLMREIGTVVAAAPEDLKSRFGVSSAADLIEAPRATFTGFFHNLVGKVKIEFWRQFGRAYCLKIARDFNATESRAERFQLKNRILNDFKPTWSSQINGFEAMVDEILTTYMSK